MQEYKYIDKQKLDIITKFAISCLNDELNKDYSIFVLMTRLYDYDGFPQISDNASYKKANFKEFYRGVKDIEHHANLLCDHNYHFGKGTICNGIYATTIKGAATNYTAKCGFSNEQSQHQTANVLTLKLNPDSKIGNILDLSDQFNGFTMPSKGVFELLEYIKTDVPFKYRDEIMRIFGNDMAKVGIALGYDAVMGGANNILAVLNRSKIIVSENEYKRVVSKSKYYNLDRTINYLYKYEDNFFPEV